MDSSKRLSSRLASAATLVTFAALAATGCGSSGNQPSPPVDLGAGAAGAAKTADAAVAATPSHHAKASRHSATARLHAVHVKSKTSAQSHRHAVKATTKISHPAKQHVRHHAAAPARPHTIKGPTAAQRRKAALAAAHALLGTLGLRDARVSVNSSGTVVGIDVPASKACGLAPNTTTRISSGIKQAAKTVRSVTVAVAGTGSSLSSYVSSHCHQAAPPTGSGQKVFDKTGNGMVTTDPITVTGKRWTLSFANYAGFFSVQVEKDGKLTGDIAYSQDPGSDKKVFDDGPGKFVLKISGAAWAVQVFDGA